MGTTNNSNILFKLSGVSQGLYIFEQNPERYDVYSPKKENNILQLLVGENIYQRPLLDNTVRKMEWSVTSYSVYSGLAQFANRNIYQEPDIVYFWDGTVSEFQGTAIQVIDVYGKPITSNYPKWKIEMQIKPVSSYDNKKEIV